MTEDTIQFIATLGDGDDIIECNMTKIESVSEVNKKNFLC